jgi:acetyl-CoA carboxylase biotin carboxyl carrier protein
MTIDEIKELIRVVQETGIRELEVRRGDNSVRIASNIAPLTHDVILPNTPLHQPLPFGNPAQGTAPPVPAPYQENDQEEATVVKSPIVGTYYDAPSPGAPPFVRVGDQVEPGKVLCIIESMKLMNEIEAEITGTVTAKLVESGKPVEYGESLFTIRPR